MPVATTDTDFRGSSTRGTASLSLTATGCAMMSALVGLFVLCYLARFVWPASGLAHGWVGLFATQPDNVVRTLIEGVVGSAVAAWLAAVLFVPVYNRVVSGSR